MAKEAEIVESSTKLMDPAGKEFQAMLAGAQAKAVEKLAVKDDSTMVEDTIAEPEKADKAELEPPKKDEPDEAPDDNMGNLKEEVSGLKAELARVRKQRTSGTEEASSLKERIADMEGQLKVLRETKTAGTVEDKLAKLTGEQVIDNRIAWEDELADARAAGQTATRDNDSTAAYEANTRIANARKMLKLYDIEKDRRSDLKVSSKQAEVDDHKEVSDNLDNLFTSVYKEVPEMLDKESDIWKAGLGEYKALPALMKRLGPLGELVAIASAIAKHPELVGKKVTQKVVANIEAAADKAFQKGGTAPNKFFQTSYNHHFTGRLTIL